MAINQTVEILRFKGQFGPIKADIADPLIIDILPLTVFIGPQGSGKSLTSQILHFFRDVDYLLAKYTTEYDSPESAIRNIMEWLRAGSRGSRGSYSRRDLSAFVPRKTANFGWGEVTRGQDGEEKISISHSVSINAPTHKIKPDARSGRKIRRSLEEMKKTPSSRLKYQRQALFIPAERLMYARLVNVASGVLSDTYMPLTMVEMVDALSKAREIWQDWKAGKPMPAEAIRIWEIIAPVLGGDPKYEERGPLANTWQWIPGMQGSRSESQPKTAKAIQIEMASSGQMSTWPLVLMLQTIFAQGYLFSVELDFIDDLDKCIVSKKLCKHFEKYGKTLTAQAVVEVKQAQHSWTITEAETYYIQRENQKLNVLDQQKNERPKYIHIEEPESHLHPLAQRAVAEIIGYLINRGFRIVVSTHSLTMVYALNNLIMAHQTFGADQVVSGFPSPDVRISPDQVSAYLFHDQTIENINDPENNQIIERRLGEIMGNMEIEYNKMRYYRGGTNAAPETT
jgi:hypothetical protein